MSPYGPPCSACPVPTPARRPQTRSWRWAASCARAPSSVRWVLHRSGHRQSGSGRDRPPRADLRRGRAPGPGRRAGRGTGAGAVHHGQRRAPAGARGAGGRPGLAPAPGGGLGAAGGRRADLRLDRGPRRGLRPHGYGAGGATGGQERGAPDLDPPFRAVDPVGQPGHVGAIAAVADGGGAGRRCGRACVRWPPIPRRGRNCAGKGRSCRRTRSSTGAGIMSGCATRTNRAWKGRTWPPSAPNAGSTRPTSCSTWPWPTTSRPRWRRSCATGTTTRWRAWWRTPPP